jgi:hypothetical protein
MGADVHETVTKCGNGYQRQSQGIEGASRGKNGPTGENVHKGWTSARRHGRSPTRGNGSGQDGLSGSRRSLNERDETSKHDTGVHELDRGMGVRRPGH